MKVLNIIKSIDIGGIEKMTLDFCSHAYKAGIEPHLICIGGGAMESDFRKSGAHFSIIKKIQRPFDIVDPFLIFRLRRYIKKHRIDIVYCRFADEGLHAWLATRGLKKTAVALEFAVDLGINRKIDNKKFRWLAKRTEANIAPSQTMLQQMHDYKMNQSPNNHFVHYGIDPDRVAQSHSTLRKELGIPQNALLAGMVGNFYNNVRDQLTVCKALPTVIEKHPDFHFVFAGGYRNHWIKANYEYYNACLDFCKSHNIMHRVHFIGLRKDTSNIYAALDFYVHATHFDTFGLAPVEAMLNRKAVIANDLPVFREISKQGQGMLLFDHKNHHELARKIIFLIENQETRETLAMKHYIHALENYHIDIHLKNIKKLFQKILKENKKLP